MSDTESIQRNIEAIEEAYEFMLAYAAQGRLDEGAGPDGAHIRAFLERFLVAAEALAGQATVLVGQQDADGDALAAAFHRDSDTIVSVLRLLLGQPSISSEMVDNTNGLIAMRSYLTTLFFIDKVLLSGTG